MGVFAIQVEKLSKRYHIGVANRRNDTLRDEATDLAARLFHRNGAVRTSRREASTIWALKEVSFEVGPGELVGIIGANGAGKSTLLKILSRITAPTSGHAEMYGRLGSLLEVGTGFHPELSGRENIYLQGSILGMRRAEIDRRFNEIVEFAEIGKFLDTPVKRYSSGMYVRLAFAVAAHLEPDILIVDEVLAVGDASFQKKCLDRLDGFGSAEGRTVLLVSHNMSTIAAICTRALLLEHGSVAFDGTVEGAIARYQSSLGGFDASAVDLRNWPHRYGPAEFARITRMEVFDESARPTRVIAMGEGMRVRLWIDFSRHVQAPEVGIALSNFLGQRVAHLVSAWEGFSASVDTGEYAYEIHIPKILLVPGVYSLTCWVKREGQASASDDGIEAALKFEVAPSEVNGRTRQFEAYCKAGEVYIESEWAISGSG